MSCEFDLFVPPLSRSVMASDQAGAVEAAEITVDEGVSRFRFPRGSFRETEMPLAIFIPGVRLQKCVLVTGVRLDVAPVAGEDVLATLDQAHCPGDRPFVHGVLGHAGNCDRETARRGGRGRPRKFCPLCTPRKAEDIAAAEERYWHAEAKKREERNRRTREQLKQYRKTINENRRKAGLPPLSGTAA